MTRTRQLRFKCPGCKRRLERSAFRTADGHKRIYCTHCREEAKRRAQSRVAPGQKLRVIPRIEPELWIEDEYPVGRS